MNKIIRTVVAFLLTALLAAASVLMIGPQIMVIVPLVLLSGIVFAVRRSFYALVCFGYPLSFGLLSAFIGLREISGYEKTTAFVISLVIGGLGIGLVVVGFLKALPSQANEITERI